MAIAISRVSLLFCSVLLSVKCLEYYSCVNREDTNPCYYKSKLRRAGPNEYSIHITKYRSKKIINKCKVKSWGEYVGDIPNLGTDEMKILYSPGFEFDEPYYLPNLRVEYKVHCNADELAFYNITSLNLPNKTCSNRCKDYVEIQRRYYGKIEECGSSPSQYSVVEVEDGTFTVVFRTNPKNSTNYTGFQMYVTCFKPAERVERDKRSTLPSTDCVEASEFVCAAGGNMRGKKCACHHHSLQRYKKYIPNEEEQRELVLMTKPLLDCASRNSTNFIFFNDTDSLGDLCLSYDDADRNAVLAALRGQLSCNPVLRAQSRATLKFFSELNGAYVNSLSTFPISCYVSNYLLRCTSNGHTTQPRLTRLTKCHTNTDSDPQLCDDAFGHSGFNVSGMRNVTISAVNCLGQRATYKVVIR